MANIFPYLFGYLTIITGILLIIGLLTQIAAIITIYLFLSLYLIDKDIHVFNFQKSFYLINIIVCLSLLILGAGIFAVDLPL